MARLNELCNKAIREFCVQWFLDYKIGVGEVAYHATSARDHVQVLDDEIWYSSSAQISLGVNRYGVRQLAHQALDIDSRELLWADQISSEVIEAFEKKLLESLLNLLQSALAASSTTPVQQLLSADPPAYTGGYVEAELIDPDEHLLARVRVAAETPLKQLAWPGRTATPIPLGKRFDALQTTPVTVAANLGQVTLTLDEISQLAVGDVLLLDHPLSDPISLFVGTHSQRFAVGDLVQANAVLHVAITSASHS